MNLELILLQLLLLCIQKLKQKEDILQCPGRTVLKNWVRVSPGLGLQPVAALRGAAVC